MFVVIGKGKRSVIESVLFPHPSRALHSLAHLFIETDVRIQWVVDAVRTYGKSLPDQGSDLGGIQIRFDSFQVIIEIHPHADRQFVQLFSPVVRNRQDGGRDVRAIESFPFQPFLQGTRDPPGKALPCSLKKNACLVAVEEGLVINERTVDEEGRGNAFPQKNGSHHVVQFPESVVEREVEGTPRKLTLPFDSLQ